MNSGELFKDEIAPSGLQSTTTSKHDRDTFFVCGCYPDQRSACTGLPFYGEYMHRNYCVLHFPSKDKEVAFHEALERKIRNGDFNFRGVWFPSLSLRFQNFHFNSKVDFSRATFGRYADFSSAIFESEAHFSQAIFLRKRRANFSGARFLAEANFANAEFCGGAIFLGATFNEADFSKAVFGHKANFSKVSFSKNAKYFRTTFCNTANFSATTFFDQSNFSEARFGEKQDVVEGARFINTMFEGPTSFWQARFDGTADFYKATFNEKVTFVKAHFSSIANFRASTFGADARFAGDEDNEVFNPSAETGGFQYVQVHMPERFSFQTVTLRPNWFINVDARSFLFTDVRWRGSFGEELEAARTQVNTPHPLLTKTYRELAMNAEESRRYSEAGRFNYWAMDTQRKEKWAGFVPWRLDWWYWLLSGYGERQVRAAAWLVLILLIFAAVYTFFGFPSNRCVDFLSCGETFISQSVPYSLGAMTLQNPEPKPETGVLQFFVFSEGILGPLQIALLALAIRRKFMR